MNQLEDFIVNGFVSVKTLDGEIIGHIKTVVNQLVVV